VLALRSGRRGGGADRTSTAISSWPFEIDSVDGRGPITRPACA
jgi:hypothetical protein